ncbi:MAG: flavin reductase, partial [Bacteroidota bacterium]
MRRLSDTDVAQLPDLFRRNLMNCLSGYKSAHLIGTADASGNTNLAVFNSVVHIGANPPFIGFIQRPLTVPRHTYSNLRASGYYTLNHIGAKQVEAAHQTSAKYEEGQSEFEATGMPAEYLGNFPAPYVAGSPIRLGLKFQEEHPIKANGTVLVIGRVMEVHIP